MSDVQASRIAASQPAGQLACLCVALLCCWLWLLLLLLCRAAGSAADTANVCVFVRSCWFRLERSMPAASQPEINLVVVVVVAPFCLNGNRIERVLCCSFTQKALASRQPGGQWKPHEWFEHKTPNDRPTERATNQSRVACALQRRGIGMRDRKNRDDGWFSCAVVLAVVVASSGSSRAPTGGLAGWLARCC